MFTESCSKRYLFCLCVSHLWCSARHCTGLILMFSLYKWPAWMCKSQWNYYVLMTALSIDVYITNRIQNFYKKTLTPFKHGHQHGNWILMYPNAVWYTLLKLQDIRWRTPIAITFTIHHCYPQITVNSLVSLCSSIWDMNDRHVQDITAS